MRALDARLRRRSFRGRLAGALLVLFVIVPQSFCYAIPADPVATMQAILRDLDLQDMPKPEAPPPRHDAWNIPPDLARAILIGALAVAIGFALFAVRDTLPRWPRARPRKTASIGSSPPDGAHLARMEASAADAEALAAAGRYAEAMHMLLLRGLFELRQRLPQLVTDASTSREILRRSQLPPDGTSALHDLIDRVEVVHFGRRPARHVDYQACRNSYGRVLAAMRLDGGAT